MTRGIQSQINEAVVVWLSMGTSPFPVQNDAAVLMKYGPQLGARLLDAIRRLDADYYASDAHHRATDLTDMGAQASAEFRRLHPEVSEDAVQALEWSYTWDYK